MMLSFFFLCAFVLVAQVPSATQVVPEDVPGIVKAGTKIELVKGGLDGADDPIGLFTKAEVNVRMISRES